MSEMSNVVEAARFEPSSVKNCATRSPPMIVEDTEEWSIYCAILPFPAGVQFESVSNEVDSPLILASIVICAAETSAAMEALLLGKLVTIVTEPGKLVASPVFGYAGVEIARNSEDLSRSLHSWRKSFASELAKLEPCQSYRQQFMRWAEVLIESS